MKKMKKNQSVWRHAWENAKIGTIGAIEAWKLGKRGAIEALKSFPSDVLGVKKQDQ